MLKNLTSVIFNVLLVILLKNTSAHNQEIQDHPSYFILYWNQERLSHSHVYLAFNGNAYEANMKKTTFRKKLSCQVLLF